MSECIEEESRNLVAGKHQQKNADGSKNQGTKYKG